MTDSWMKARSKGQHRDSDHREEAPAMPVPPPVPPPGPQGPPDAGNDVQQAMQMLTLAQRTADDHVATAHRHAEKIQLDARAAAEQIVREAQAQAENVRREADRTLSEARAHAEQAGKEAQAHAVAARQNGDKIRTDAQAQAAAIAQEARTNAENLVRQAQRRYEEEVGNLAAKRETLQQQIEALQEFDRDYRARLLTFMQAQLRALWVDEPRVDGELPEGGPVPMPREPEPEPAAAAPTDRPADTLRR